VDKNATDEGVIEPRSKKPNEDLPARPRYGKTPSRDRQDRSRLALATAIITLVGASAADPLPDDLRQALEAINSPGQVRTDLF
jgi:hypothetical protein